MRLVTAVPLSADWDLGVCLQYECRRKQIRKPSYFNHWIDLRVVYKQFYDRRPAGLCGSLEDLGIPFTGREHCGKCYIITGEQYNIGSCLNVDIYRLG